MTQGDRRPRDDEQGLVLAVFRYGVLGPLIDGDPVERGDVGELVAKLAGQTHYRPGVGPVSVAERTVYDWLARYRRGGLAALCPQQRKDQGHSRTLDPAVLDRAIQLRKEIPKRTTKTLLDILGREGRLPKDAGLHRATLDRWLARAGASRRQLHIVGTPATIKMQVALFGDLWVGDYHHGPLVLGLDGQPVTSKLGAFIDHKTRYPVAQRYYLDEQLATLRDTLLRALLRWGKATKVYVDRGAVYRAEQLAYSLDRIGCHLIHSRAYYSQGRGVIERWWQNAQAFEAEVAARSELLTIHELNRLWEAYCELRYCQEIHSELGMTPNEALADVVPKPLDPEAARELFLVRLDQRKVHDHDGCIDVEGRRYLCDRALRGQKVQVRFDPSDRSYVLVFRDGVRLQRAYPQPINAPPEKAAVIEPVPQTVDYLGLLRDDFDRQLIEHARPLAYASLRADPGFDKDGFARVVQDLAGLTLTPTDRRELTVFWDQFGPLPESLVRIGVEHAVRLDGRGRHVRLYLHAVRTLVLAHWQRPENPEKAKENA